MDAHQPVTLKEGDRYPLRPPNSCCEGKENEYKRYGWKSIHIGNTRWL